LNAATPGSNKITSPSVSIPAREVERAPVRPPPAALVWKARLRATLMPVLVGVMALLATVVIGRLRMPAGPVVSSGAALPRRAPTVVIGGPTAPATAATAATPDSQDGVSAAAPESVAADLIVVAAPEPLELPPAPSLSPPAQPRSKGNVQAPAAPGGRLMLRQRPPRPIDSDSPYAR